MMKNVCMLNETMKRIRVIHVRATTAAAVSTITDKHSGSTQFSTCNTLKKYFLLFILFRNDKWIFHMKKIINIFTSQQYVTIISTHALFLAWILEVIKNFFVIFGMGLLESIEINGMFKFLSLEY